MSRKIRRKALAIKGNPQYGQRIETPLKGKGSYRRARLRAADVKKAPDGAFGVFRAGDACPTAGFDARMGF